MDPGDGGLMRVVVLGAGPAGLAAARWAQAGGAEVVVVEQGAAVGGLARSVRWRGADLDLGSHVFTTDDLRVAALWHDAAGAWRWVPVRRGVHTGDRVVSYPFSPARLLREHPRLAAAVALGWARQRVAPAADDGSARARLTARYGHTAVDRLFASYVQKLYGLDPAQVDADFVDALPGARRDRGGLHPHPDDPRRVVVLDPDPARPRRFRWPEAGTGSLWPAMARGLQIHPAAPVQRVELGGGRVRAVVAGGARFPADAVVSTIPLPALLRALHPGTLDLAPTAARSTLVLYLHLDRDPGTPWSWVHLYPLTTPAGRVTFFRHWHPSLARFVAVELWTDAGGTRWEQGADALGAETSHDLERAGLLGGARLEAAHVERLPGSHPVLYRGYRADRDALLSRLAGVHGLHLAGRHGTWVVDSLAEAMRSGVEAAERALEGRAPTRAGPGS